MTGRAQEVLNRIAGIDAPYTIGTGYYDAPQMIDMAKYPEILSVPIGASLRSHFAARITPAQITIVIKGSDSVYKFGDNGPRLPSFPFQSVLRVYKREASNGQPLTRGYGQCPPVKLNEEFLKGTSPGLLGLLLELQAQLEERDRRSREHVAKREAKQALIVRADKYAFELLNAILSGEAAKVQGATDLFVESAFDASGAEFGEQDVEVLAARPSGLVYQTKTPEA